MTLEEAIKNRHSVRTYSPTRPDEETINRVKRFCSDAQNILNGEKARVVMIDKSISGKIGTYGVIRGAECYLALLYSKRSKLSAVNAGMVMENIVLQLTRIGLSSVWLGGTISKSDITKIIDVRDDEYIAALIPFGYAAENESLTSRVMSKISGSRKRKSIDDLFTIQPGSDFQKSFEMMRVAPSSLNSQPWRAIEDRNAVHFFTTTTKGFGLLDLGIGLAHFAAFASKGCWRVVDNAQNLRNDSEYVISYLQQ